MQIENILGWFGAIIILICYVLNSVGLWKTSSDRYKLLNFIGSLFLVISGLYIKAYPFVIVNAFWAISSIISLFRKS